MVMSRIAAEKCNSCYWSPKAKAVLVQETAGIVPSALDSLIQRC